MSARVVVEVQILLCCIVVLRLRVADALQVKHVPCHLLSLLSFRVARLSSRVFLLSPPIICLSS